uniref:Uncharacterized protein n=1 Tax=Pyxicephalus adspersus TaxID=30357 RepID=A0AAV3AYF9_PYXAD|nr:TPA: hypothetical protein GDO54_007409 [Pyxicephalus adspersus]
MSHVYFHIVKQHAYYFYSVQIIPRVHKVELNQQSNVKILVPFCQVCTTYLHIMGNRVCKATPLAKKPYFFLVWVQNYARSYIYQNMHGSVYNNRKQC